MRHLAPITLLFLAACSPGDNDAGQRASDAIFMEDYGLAIDILQEPGRAVYHNEFGHALIHSAVMALDPDLVRAVLEDGHDIDERDEDGNTALDLVAALTVAGYGGGAATSIANMLVERGGESELWEELVSVQIDIEAELRRELERSFDDVEREAWEAMHGR